MILKEETVITSYSIHYTKLYEIELLAAILAQHAHGIGTALLAVGHLRHRITSYNVCYTKLLRLLTGTDIA